MNSCFSRLSLAKLTRKTVQRGSFTRFMAPALLLLACPSWSLGLSVVVATRGPVPYAKQGLQVAVVFDGKPAPGAKIEVGRISGDGEPLLLVTDSLGKATLPELPAGEYHIRVAPAQSPNFTEGIDFCLAECAINDLEVTNFTVDSLNGTLHPIDRSALGMSEFVIDLARDRIPEWAQQIATAERDPTVLRAREIRGVVLDQSGAVIPGASIDVIRKGGKANESIAGLQSDPSGRFLIPVPDGDYFVLISSPGFAPRALQITVSASGSTDDLQLVLTVGQETQTITVAHDQPAGR
jgi:hypothetical protein